MAKWGLVGCDVSDRETPVQTETQDSIAKFTDDIEYLEEQINGKDHINFEDNISLVIYSKERTQVVQQLAHESDKLLGVESKMQHLAKLTGF
jgi:hypothetical protein